MPSPSLQLLNSLNTELAAAIGKAQKSLVKIQNGRSSAGAGTIIHSDGLIITNAHVVSSKALTLTLWDGETKKGKVAAVDRKKDLAAVTIDKKALSAAEMISNDRVQPGQWVVAIGHPWGVNGAVTAGIVIAVGRPVEDLPYDGELIQASLRLRPGHSGGPMMNKNGLLVGINTMISGPEVGLAVPVNSIKKFLKQSLGADLLGVT